jgi:fructuronate reductase
VKLRLSRANLPRLNAGACLPLRPRGAARLGVLHFGPGAFHRAHQAWYFDRALDDDSRWGISEIALRSATFIDPLVAQDGMYTLVSLGDSTERRIVRSIGELNFVERPFERARVLQRFVDPDLQLITLTVTEKGYCLAANGELDLTHPDIQADLATPNEPRSAIGWLVAGLGARLRAARPAVTVISCDNRTANGTRLAQAAQRYAELVDVEAAAWMRDAIAFPNSMVDAITPAATPELRDEVEHALGLRDEAVVQRESFCQWVIEERFSSARPDFAALGVTLTTDVSTFERAKLRILNGAHSTLAYVGLHRGHETVRDAMLDQVLEEHVERLVRDEILPSLGTPMDAYAAATLARFRNRALRHALAQIAWDGSQKLPYRILETVADNLAAGRSVERLAVTIAAWLLFARRMTARRAEIVDPLADRLRELAQHCTGDAALDVARLLALREVFPEAIAQSARLRSAVERAYRALQNGELSAT